MAPVAPEEPGAAVEQGRHLWVRGPSRAARIRLLAGLDVPPVLAVADAHRRLRGPYTAAGTLLRQLVPLALQRWPRLVACHQVEILAAAPELTEVIPANGSTAVGRHFHPPSRTLRIANGLAEFLCDLQSGQSGQSGGQGGATILFDNAQHADPTDVELIVALLRRVDPTVLTVVAGTTAAPVPDRLVGELRLRCAELVTHPPLDDDPEPGVGVGLGAVPGRVTSTADDPVAAFVAADGTSDDERLRAAYQRATPARRAQLHDRRAEELERSGEFSWRLGALPWHRELGRDPTGQGAAALRFAADHCLRMGFHDAAAELAARGRAVVDRRSRPREWWAFTTKLTASQAALGRLGRAEVEAQRAYAAEAGPAARHHVAFADAMVGAGDLDDADRHGVLAWVAGAAQLPAPLAASVLELGRQAVVVLLRRDLPRAVELVDDAVEQLGSGHAGLRAVLLGNRAHLNARLRRWEAALADRTAAVVLEPSHPDHHHEQAVVLHRLGRHLEAIAAFDRAIGLSPPFPQAHRARSDTRGELGDTDGAIADLRYVLELWPGDVDALARRAALLQEDGRDEEAVADFDAVLAVADDPDARRGRELSLRRIRGGRTVLPVVPLPRG